MTVPKISKDHSEPGHTILIVADSYITKFALDNQCEALAASDFDLKAMHISMLGKIELPFLSAGRGGDVPPERRTHAPIRKLSNAEASRAPSAAELKFRYGLSFNST